MPKNRDKINHSRRDDNLSVRETLFGSRNAATDRWAKKKNASNRDKMKSETRKGNM